MKIRFLLFVLIASLTALPLFSEPWIVKITPFLKHGLPTGVSDFLSDAFGANQSMDHWKGHGGPPGQN